MTLVVRVARHVGMTLAALLCFACSEGSGGEGPRTAADTVDPDEERHGKEAAAAAGTGAPAPTVAEPVDEGAAADVAPFDPAVLPEAARERLRDVSLPVLLPAPEAVGGKAPYARAVATRGAHWYSVAVPDDGASLSIFGTRKAVVRPGLAPPEEERGAQDPTGKGQGTSPHISRTHGIVQATFRRFGAAYSVEVTCEAPETDPRCTKDAYVRRLVAAMRRLGDDR
jgi:hypothetical protein